MTTERPFLVDADGARQALLATSDGHAASAATVAGSLGADKASDLPGIGRPASPSVLPLVDLAACCAVLVSAASSFDAYSLQGRWVLFGIVLIQIALFALFLANGLYDRRVLHGAGSILRAAALPGAVALATSAAAGEIAYGDRLGTIMGTLAIATCGAMVAARLLWLGLMRAQGRMVDDPVVLVGPSDDVAEFLQDVTPAAEASRARRFVGYLATDPGGPGSAAVELPRLGRVEGAAEVRSLLARLPLRTTLVVVTRDPDSDQVRAMMPVLLETCFAVRMASLPMLRLRRGTLTPAADLDATVVIQPPSITQSQRAVKRMLDVGLASLALTLLAPLLALIALAIKLDSPGPVFFRQERHGLNNRPFRIFKFRTMRFVPQARFEQARRNDPRVTRIGAFLRKTSIDELPQLLNVLGGTMSLVGPRPHPVELNERFAPQVERLFARHRLPPGLTGLAQVSGNRGETPTADVMQDRVNHDLRYIRTFRPWSDVRIIFMTCVMIWRNKDVY